MENQLTRSDYLGIFGIVAGVCAYIIPAGPISKILFFIAAVGLVLYAMAARRTAFSFILGLSTILLMATFCFPSIVSDLNASSGSGGVMSKLHPWHFLVIGLSVAALGITIAAIGVVWEWPPHTPAANTNPVSFPLPITTTPPTEEKRSFTSKTPQQLMGFYKGMSGLQADLLMEPFKGEWIKASLVISRILPDTQKGHTFGQMKTLDGSTLVECRFDERWYKRVVQFNDGDTIQVIGQISTSQNGAQLYLRNCEIL